jgi:pimeloyl-ACP methyl ester carboxylesterase
MLKSVEKDIKVDARRTFACIEKLHQNVDVLGRSLGTGVALHVAAHENVRRLGLITPYDSIVDIAQSRYKWMPVKFMLRDRFESWRDAMKVKAPIFAVLAETDPVTPHKCWENLKRHFTTHVGVVTAPNTDHSNIVQSPVTWNELQAFFEHGFEPGVVSTPKI